MGTWGTGLFSDDTALDVKGDWEELYARYGEPEQVTRIMFEDRDFDDPDMGPVAILALAMCQWKYGCLLPEIKDRALKVVQEGAGLELWVDTKNLAKRKAVYAAVAAKLESAQPPRKRIKAPRPIEACPFKPGQLIKYRCHDGDWILLWVTGWTRYKGDRLPLCAALDWKGKSLPAEAQIRRLKPVYSEMDRFNTQWFAKVNNQVGSRQTEQPGLPWSGFAPREMYSHGFDPARASVVDGEWHWDLAEPLGGPYVPCWISLGPVVLGELTETRRFRGTLQRQPIDTQTMLHGVLPANPLAQGAALSDTTNLGTHVHPPPGKKRKRSLFLELKKTKHNPQPGDVFIANVLGKRWVVGRVILNDGHFIGGPADVLAYFYKSEFSSTDKISLPMPLTDLLIPPCVLFPCWEDGHYLLIGNRPLDPIELPARHVFAGADGLYRDAYGLPIAPAQPNEIVGSSAVGGADYHVAQALGLV